MTKDDMQEALNNAVLVIRTKGVLKYGRYEREDIIAVTRALLEELHDGDSIREVLEALNDA